MVLQLHSMDEERTLPNHACRIPLYLKGSIRVLFRGWNCIKLSSCGHVGQDPGGVLSFPLCRNRVWPDLITYNTAISACSKGQWQIALLLLEDLIGEELVDCVSYNSAVSACCGGSQWEKAFHILQMMTLNHVLPDSITLHVLILSFEYPNLTRHESWAFISRPWWDQLSSRSKVQWSNGRMQQSGKMAIFASFFGCYVCSTTEP